MPARIWRFAEFKFDELRHELRRGGELVEAESKPKELLTLLLEHAERVVTQSEILEHVWGGRQLSEATVGVALNKLRDAFGDANRQRIVRTVKGGGYTMAVPVVLIDSSEPTSFWATLVAGDPVPLRPGWILSERLGATADTVTWRVRRQGAEESRVVHLSWTPSGTLFLRQEAHVLTRLQEAGAEGWRFGRLFEAHGEGHGYLLEVEDLGSTLAEWALQQGGLKAVPEPVRVRIVTEVAAALQSAHQLRVIHGNLTPAQIHVCPRGEELQVRLSGFRYGPGLPLREPEAEPSSEAEQPPAPASRPLQRSMYLAPELGDAQQPSERADIYAAGVILYQIITANLNEGPLPGWQERVADPMLRQDIADSASVDLGRRLVSAGELGARLRTLAERRRQSEESQQFRQRMELAESELAMELAGRPWRRALALTLACGCLLCLWLFWRANTERKRAEQQAALNAAMNDFLATDLLERDSPTLQKGGPRQTLDEAIQAAAGSIDRRFGDQPAVAARLHDTIARALASQTEFMAANREFAYAAASFRKVDGPLSQRALVDDYERATMLARSTLPGTLSQSRSVIEAADGLLKQVADPMPETSMWQAEAEGVEAIVEGNGPRGLERLRAAAHIATTAPGILPQQGHIMQQRLIAAEMKVGDPAAAERDARDLIARASPAEGVTGPAVLGARLTLIEAIFLQGRFSEAIPLANDLYPQLVAKLGPANQQTLTLLGTREASEGEMEQWEPSIRDGLELHRLAAASEGETSYLSEGALLDAALSECRKGDAAAGTAHSHQALQEIETKGEGLKGLEAGAKETLAACLTLPGHLRRHGIPDAAMREARALLEHIDIPAVEKMTSDPTWGSGVLITRAQLEYMAQDDAAARRDVQAASVEMGRGRTGNYEQRSIRELQLALGMQ